MRGQVIDINHKVVGERTIAIVPAQRASLEAGETMQVHSLIEGIRQHAWRINTNIEVVIMQQDIDECAVVIVTC